MGRPTAGCSAQARVRGDETPAQRATHAALILLRALARAGINGGTARPRCQRVRLAAVVPQLLQARIGPPEVGSLGEPAVPAALQVVTLGDQPVDAVVLLAGISARPRPVAIRLEGLIARDDRPPYRGVREQAAAAVRRVEAPVPGDCAVGDRQRSGARDRSAIAV